ncbi:MAG: Dam family site-specific DNA-(adenine-N6)-methyltransferase [Acidobacteriales bacterium]|nr:Dam family site-specific DNA-(adenine-N6)-methyltransferase [Terriglobales bacterium]
MYKTSQKHQRENSLHGSESIAEARFHDTNTDKAVVPFLKWPGGKRWIVPQLLNVLGSFQFERYFEPFLGGGALFFALRPSRALLSDLNPDLINTYVQVKQNAAAITRKLRRLPVSAEKYDRMRASSPASRFERAVRFLYLNRTAFGGIYRLNREGVFNVPFGGGQRTPEALWRDGLLANAACVLKTARFLTCDFEKATADVGENDLVYCDPTYTVAHSNNGFVRYNERNFAWDDQKRLAACCQRLARRRIGLGQAHDSQTSAIARF